MRSTKEVLDRHLELRQKGDLETDLQENYSEEVVLLTDNSVVHGHDGLRYSADRLAVQLPESKFKYVSKSVEGEYALLVWKAHSNKKDVHDGADSFVIRDGKIIMQTIFYRLVTD